MKNRQSEAYNFYHKRMLAMRFIKFVIFLTIITFIGSIVLGVWGIKNPEQVGEFIGKIIHGIESTK